MTTLHPPPGLPPLGEWRLLGRFNRAETALLAHSARFTHQARRQQALQEPASGVDVCGAGRRGCRRRKGWIPQVALCPPFRQLKPSVCALGDQWGYTHHEFWRVKKLIPVKEKYHA